MRLYMCPEERGDVQSLVWGLGNLGRLVLTPFPFMYYLFGGNE